MTRTLGAGIDEWAKRYGRYGYGKIAAWPRATAGWVANERRVERIWRREGLEVSTKQHRRGLLRLNDSSCIRLRAAQLNHAWS